MWRHLHPRVVTTRRAERSQHISKMAGAAPARKVSLLLRGWNEIPEVIGSTVMMMIGIGLAGVGAWNYYRKDGDNKKYKLAYVVYRPDDPRAAKIKAVSSLDK